jgi:hypothetical protein
MTAEWMEIIQKETSAFYSRYYPEILLEGFGKNTKGLGHDSRCSDRESNSEPPE